MPQPVQPPEIPAIIQSVTSEDEARLDKSSNGIPVSLQTRRLQTEGLSLPTPAETFAPDYSLLSAKKSAALLGPPISIGYSVQPAPENPNPERISTSEKVSSQESEGFAIRGTGTAGRSPNSTLAPAVVSSPLSVVSSTKQQITENGQGARTSEEFSLYPLRFISDFFTSNSSSVTLKTPNVKRLVAQERGGEVREFELTIPTPETQPPPAQQSAPAPNEGETAPQAPESPEPGTAIPVTPFGVGGVIELTADRQEYDEPQKVITAQGNVVLRFREALLNADRVRVNLPNRLIVAEGNVSLTRGQQVLRGERFEYYFVQDSGVILNANGEFYTPTSGTDLTLLTPTDGPEGTVPPRPLSDRITNAQPLQNVTNPGGYSFVLGAGRDIQNVARPQTGGTVNRFRYEAERVDFDGQSTFATNVRITNDPFSPPELELRADTAQFRRVEPLVDEIVASRPRLVLDQGFEVPILRNRITLDRRPRDPALVNFGFDADDRGGLFAERTFEVINTPNVRFRVTPQYFLQRAILDEGVIDPSVFGLRTQLDATLGPRTTLRGRGVLTSLDFGEVEDELRASLRLQQIIGTSLPHTLNVEYSYRDRFYNGSLGYQTVQSSLSAVLASPYIALGDTGIYLNYQAGVQYINDDTDRVDLLEPGRDNDRISLARFQATATLSRDFLLWQGQSLPATPTEGLRYTPAPVLPNLRLNTAISGVTSLYTNGDTQESLSGTIGLVGQLGHFSRPYLDYTGFNISYTQVLLGNESPFLFDRVADTSILSGGITQQIYGPFRLGFQTSFSLDNNQQISTDYFLEYSRRTHNILLRYNPVLGLGSISFQISDFNWTGNPGLFGGSGGVRPVMEGVTR